MALVDVYKNFLDKWEKLATLRQEILPNFSKPLSVVATCRLSKANRDKLYRTEKEYNEALEKWYTAVCLKRQSTAFNEEEDLDIKEMQSITTKEKAVEVFGKIQVEVYEKELAANKAAIKLEIIRKIYKSFRNDGTNDD